MGISLLFIEKFPFDIFYVIFQVLHYQEEFYKEKK